MPPDHQLTIALSTLPNCTPLYTMVPQDSTQPRLGLLTKTSEEFDMPIAAAKRLNSLYGSLEDFLHQTLL